MACLKMNVVCGAFARRYRTFSVSSRPTASDTSRSERSSKSDNSSSSNCRPKMKLLVLHAWHHQADQGAPLKIRDTGWHNRLAQIPSRSLLVVRQLGTTHGASEFLDEERYAVGSFDYLTQSNSRQLAPPKTSRTICSLSNSLSLLSKMLCTLRRASQYGS